MDNRIQSNNSKIYVFSGPAGAGKTTLVKKLFQKKYIRENYIKGISYTTRKIRRQERPGKDYYFVCKEEFQKLKKNDFFLESERVVDDYYGTPRFLYALAKQQQKDLILCIDVKGGVYLKKNLKQGTIVTIFISAPSERDLYRRLEIREEKQEVIEKRIGLAKKEMQFSKDYDYLIVNHEIKKTLKILEAVLLGEKFRR